MPIVSGSFKNTAVNLFVKNTRSSFGETVLKPTTKKKMPDCIGNLYFNRYEGEKNTRERRIKLAPAPEHGDPREKIRLSKWIATLKLPTHRNK